MNERRERSEEDQRKESNQVQATFEVYNQTVLGKEGERGTEGETLTPFSLCKSMALWVEVI